MRGAFLRGLVDLATRDNRVMLLTADLGFMAVEPFAEAHPDRFLNVGVAEQDMVGIACGLADAGFLPFCYSIATFASMRPYEFIRNAAHLHRLPVRVVGVGGGFEYGTAGASHHGLEDVALMRAQPGVTLIAPADYAQALSALRSTWDIPGVVYYRIGKDDRSEVQGLNGRFELGRIETMGAGAELLILSTGSVSVEVSAAAQQLAMQGVPSTVGVVSTLNPTPETDLANLLGQFRLAITVEAHSIAGGLGSMACEVVAERRIDCKVIRLGVRTGDDGLTGSGTYLLRRHGLDCGSIVATAVSALAGTVA